MLHRTSLASVPYCCLFAVAAYSHLSTYGVDANENGLALTPPMGWRSWNLYGSNVDQKLIENIFEGMADRSRTDYLGEPTSLCDLGYCDVGIDDNWQACDDPQAGHGMHYHDKHGRPIINVDRFPDMKQMVDYGHSLGLEVGWYANNCICRDHCASEDQCQALYEGDVEATVYFDFDSIKIDGCGNQNDVFIWERLFLEMSPKPILIEYRRPPPDLEEEEEYTCPFHFFRTSRDIRASYASVMYNLESTNKYYYTNTSYPGCWAYPDMLQVGVYHIHGPSLTKRETRSHFGAWTIVSSPLVLSHDVKNDTITDLIWDLISNREAIAINQAYAGDSGGVYDFSEERVDLADIIGGEEELTTVPLYQYLSKKLPGEGIVAVLLMNSGEERMTLRAVFAEIPGIECQVDDCAYHVRDIWNHSDLGVHEKSWSVSVDGHDAAYIVLEYVPT